MAPDRPLYRAILIAVAIAAGYGTVTLFANSGQQAAAVSYEVVGIVDTVDANRQMVTVSPRPSGKALEVRIERDTAVMRSDLGKTGSGALVYQSLIPSSFVKMAPGDLVTVGFSPHDGYLAARYIIYHSSLPPTP